MLATTAACGDDAALPAASNSAAQPDAGADASGADVVPDVDARPLGVRFAAGAPALALPGASLAFAVEIEGADDAGAEVAWSVASDTAPGVDCAAAFQLEPRGDALTLGVPRRAEDARCADVLVVTARAQSGARVAEASHRFALDLPPGLGVAWAPIAPGANPVVPLPTCPAWACLGHNDPTLDRDADGRLTIWFAAGGDRGEFPVVGRAVQEEAGGAFALAPNAPVLEPADDGATPDTRPWDYIRETVSVVRGLGASRWSMAYLGYATDYFTDPSVGLVDGLDDLGQAFPRAPAPVYTPTRPGGWDANFITSPNLLRGSDGVWRLYYTGASIQAVGGRIGLLTSEDGASWTPHPDNPVFIGRSDGWDESVLDSYVAFVGGRYLMWYTAFREPLTTDTSIALGLAESEDGIAWTRVSDDPILSPGDDGAWSSLQLAAGEVIVEPDGSLLMAAYGVPIEGPNPDFPAFRPERIGLFVSRAE